MRAVIQRVASASVTVDQRVVGSIARGLVVLIGIHKEDTATDSAWLAQKVAGLRIFEDGEGKMNRSIVDVASEPRASTVSVEPTILAISQFTLIASTRKGNRPSFNDAAKPDLAIPLYESFIRELETLLQRPVARGQFGAMMQVALVNDGPVTIILDTRSSE